MIFGLLMYLYFKDDFNYIWESINKNERSNFKKIIYIILIHYILNSILNFFNLTTYFNAVIHLLFFLEIQLFVHWFELQNQEYNHIVKLNQFLLHWCLYFKRYEKINYSLLKSSKSVLGIKIEDLNTLYEHFPKHYYLRACVEMMQAHERHGNQNLFIHVTNFEKHLNIWKKQINNMNSQLSKRIKETIVIYIFVMFISVLSVNLVKQSFDLTHLFSYQLSCFIFIILILFCMILSFSILNISYFREEEIL